MLTSRKWQATTYQLELVKLPPKYNFLTTARGSTGVLGSRNWVLETGNWELWAFLLA